MSIGKTLKEARQKKSLSVEQVYKATRIYPRIIEALEQDKYQDILNAAYIRSFLKEYSEYLGLSSEDILRHYDALSTKEEERQQYHLPEIRPKAQEDGYDIKQIAEKAKPFLAGLAALILIVLFFKIGAGIVGSISRNISQRKEAAGLVDLDKKEDRLIQALEEETRFGIGSTFNLSFPHAIFFLM